MELIIKSEITDITYQSSSKMGFFKQINNVTIVITIAERVWLRIAYVVNQD